jgi:hypothetical protein
MTAPSGQSGALHHVVERFGEDPPECIRRTVRGESAVQNGDVIGQGAYARELADALAPLRGERSLFRDAADEEVERRCVHSSRPGARADAHDKRGFHAVVTPTGHANLTG